MLTPIPREAPMIAYEDMRIEVTKQVMRGLKLGESTFSVFYPRKKRTSAVCRGSRLYTCFVMHFESSGTVHKRSAFIVSLVRP